MCSSNQAAAERWLYLVAERVGYYAKQRRKKVDIDWSGNLLTAASDWTENLLAAGSSALWSTLIKYPNASKAFLRTVVDHAILEAECTDRVLYVPMDTRRKRVGRGAEPGDFNQVPFSCIDDIPSADSWSEGIEVTEIYEAVYSLCECEIDERIIQACWDDGDSYGIGPPHYTDIATAVGVSVYKVRQRLGYLETKYYQLTDQPQPTRRRQCRSSN